MAAARILVVLGVLLAVLSLPTGYVRFQSLDRESVEERPTTWLPTTRSAVHEQEVLIDEELAAEKAQLVRH